MVKLQHLLNDAVLIGYNDLGSVFTSVVACILHNASVDGCKFIEIGIRVIGLKAYPADILIGCIKILTLYVLLIVAEPPPVLYLITLRYPNHHLEALTTW